MHRLLLTITALALVLAACGGSASIAATVDGTEVTVEDVDALFYEVEEEFTDVQFAAYLSTLIQWTAIEQRAETELGFEAMDEAIDTEIESILVETGYPGDLEGFLSEQNVSEEGLDRYATQLLIEDSVTEAVSPTVEAPTIEDARQAIDDNPMEFVQVCASHILVETEDEAVAAAGRLDAGEDFAAVAAEISTDPGSGANGGSLGCSTASTYVPAFAEATMTAPIGEVTEPVETEFGFHLILVEDRTVATADEVLSVMETQVIFDAVDTWLRDAVTNAEVVVEEQYGTWQKEPTPQVVPPPA